MIKNPENIMFEWYEVKKLFLEVVRNGRIQEYFKNNKNQDQVKFYLNEWEQGNRNFWYGGVSSTDTIMFLEKGYTIPGLALSDMSIVPLRKQRAMKFSDFDGDYNHDLFLSGADNFYSEMSKRERTPCVNLEFRMSFTSSQSAKELNTYKIWLLKQLVDIEASGIDFSLRIFCDLGGLYTHQDKSDVTNIHIIVKRENEASDYREWSSLMSPGGFRQIIFLLMIKSADMTGRITTIYLGSPITQNEYSVIYDYASDVIKIRNATHGGYFNETELTQQFYNVIEEAKLGRKNI